MESPGDEQSRWGRESFYDLPQAFLSLERSQLLIGRADVERHLSIERAVAQTVSAKGSVVTALSPCAVG